MKGKILLVDGNNLLYRSYYKFQEKGFTNKKGFPTGAIYGFFKILHSNIFRFNPTSVIVCFDRKRSDLRMKTLPQYKEQRKHIGLDFDNMNKQRKIIFRILRYMKINYILDNHFINDLEGDDYIALMYAKNCVSNDILILSSDEDFVQLLNYPNVKIINPSKDKLVTKENCEEIFGYKPNQAIDIKILCGDKSDNIPGVPGFGIKTALDFLKTYGSISKFIESGKTYKKYTKEEMLPLFNRNKLMIDLMGFLAVSKIEKIPFHLKRGKVNMITLNGIFEKYSLKSFMTKEFIEPIQKLKTYSYEN